MSTLPSFSCGTPWHYASKRWDEVTQLWQFGKRDYDSQAGRWLTPDPVGFSDGPNLYAYVHNNPMILFDPWGLTSHFHGEQHQQSFQYGCCFFNPSSSSNFDFGKFLGQGLRTIPSVFGRICSGLCHDGADLAFGQMRGYAECSELANRFCEKLGHPFPSFDGKSVNPVASHNTLTTSCHGAIDKLFHTNLACRYTPEYQAVVPALCIMPNPVSLRSLFGNSGTPSRPYTRSSLKLGQEIHKTYKAELDNGGTLRKDYVLPSGRRPDFVDFSKGIIYELKPYNPRSVRLGQRQLERYKQELMQTPQWKHVAWKTELEVY